MMFSGTWLIPVSKLHSHLLKVQAGTCATCEVHPPEASGEQALHQGGEMWVSCLRGLIPGVHDQHRQHPDGSHQGQGSLGLAHPILSQGLLQTLHQELQLCGSHPNCTHLSELPLLLVSGSRHLSKTILICSSSHFPWPSSTVYCGNGCLRERMPLLQNLRSADDQKLHPCAFFSCKLSPTEKKWHREPEASNC